jgi:hypothetical protein
MAYPFDILDEELEDAPAKLVPEGDVETPESLMSGISPEVLAAREQRDSRIADASLNQGLTEIGAALASQGRYKPSTSSFETEVKAAETTASEAAKDAAVKQKTVSDYIKAQAAASKAEQSNSYRDEFLGLRKREIEAQEKAAGIKSQERKDEKQHKLDEEMQEITTPFGVARTKSDATKLKDAAILKESFDKKLQEMIDLRKEYGSEVWDRDAVKRGTKLSSDLLLLQKDLANLGVLSKTDEKILKTIIPEDPLGYDVSQLKGNDPIMSGMTKYQKDIQSDFEANLKNRIRPGTEVAPVAGGLSPEKKKRLEELRAKARGK